MVGPNGESNLEVPITASYINDFLQDFQNGFISGFNLAIALGEVFGGEILSDFKFPKQFGNLHIFERSPIVNYDVLGDAEMIDDVVQDELQNLFSGGVG